MHRKLVIIFVIILFVLSTSACTDRQAGEGYSVPNNLMEGASPQTSALSLTVYDGTEAKRYHLFDTIAVEALLKELDKVPVKEVENRKIDDLSYPIYGLEIGDTEGWTIAACWSNGYWITDEGKAYLFDYDFEELAQNEGWQFSNSFSSYGVVPCSYWLCCEDGGWNTKFMQKAEIADAPEGVTMTLVEWGEETVKVSYSNAGDREWTYGESFVLHVEIDGVWYLVPTKPGNWGFNSIAYLLAPGGENEHSYWLGAYGELPAGKYRIASQGLYAEHIV